jgi:hypothetical protein
MKLHALADVAPQLPDDLAAPERWLTKQILSGRIRARKIGRRWYMTDDDIALMLEVFANVPATAIRSDVPTADRAPIDAVVTPTTAGISKASLRRRLRAL